MWIAKSTSPPAGAGPSATSSGSIPRACASAGTSNSANKKRSRRSIITRLVLGDDLVEVRPEPPLRLLERHAAPRRIILELVAPDPRDAEILAVAMPEIEAGHSGGRKHREILGQRDFARVPTEHLEQQRLEAVVRAGGVARRGADALVFLADQLLVRQMLLGITPQPIADFGVKHLGKALGEAVGERFEQDVGIIVVGALEPLEVRLEPVDANREAAEPILAFGIDEIGK